MRRLCETGRFLHDTVPDAQLTWSEDRPAARLDWRMAADGRQRLGFVDAAGHPLHLRSLTGATLWIDAAGGRIGALEEAMDAEMLQLVAASPEVAPEEVDALGTALPDRLAGLDLPRPRAIRQTTRAARQRVARLTLGRETARDGPRYWGSAVQLPTLTLRFVYDGQEVWEGDADPRMVEDGEIVTLTRDHRWEAACVTRLMQAGALAVDELEVHWPGERMMDCDFVFADGELNLHTLEESDAQEALDFAFRVVPELRRDGWEVVETSKWPYLACLTLTGQTQDRAAVLDAFARGDAPVFLLSLKAGGIGLTLTEADTVIFYDPWWNPAVERQAMDRTHRIGQDKPVFVHRLVAAGTVEEKILDMQARKQALADALFDGSGAASESLLDEATLQDLFAPLGS